MLNISASPSSAKLTAASVQAEKNSHNLEDLLLLVRNELYRLRIGDTRATDEQVV